VFVKMAPSELKTRLFVNLMRLGAREVAFYRQIRAAVPVPTPIVHAAESQPRRGRFVLVLEDLAARGGRFGDVRQPCTPDEAHGVVTALGRLHAAFWASPRFRGDLAWVGTPRQDPNAALVDALVRRSVGQVAVRFPSLIPDEVRRGGHLVAARRAEIDELLARGPLTLLHGDTHRGNLYFDGDQPGFFDWQVVRVGPGLRDVTYFLVVSMDTEARRAHQRDLLRAYIASLHASGGPELGADDAWHQYRLHAVDPWIASAVTAALGGLQAAEIAETALKRSVAAVQELETFGALRVLLSGPC
jgi:hypothetical protein